MAGDFHHHIPQFLQRWFAIPKTRRKDIWYFERGSAPSIEKIKEIGAEAGFYTEAVDSEITDIETPLSRLVAKVRALDIGAPVSAADAAEIVIQLAPRTAHFRAAMERGLSVLAGNVVSLFGSEASIQSVIGLDEDEPSERFRERFDNMLEGFPPQVRDLLPPPLWERVSFYLIKENFGSSIATIVPLVHEVFGRWVTGAPEVARDGHNKALANVMATPTNPRRDFLEILEWTVCAAPAEGAILPDCVSIASTLNGGSVPYMLAEMEDIAAITIPLSAHRLLVGTRVGVSAPPIMAFNAEAARCSHRLFLAGEASEAIGSLRDLIGERSTSVVEDALHEVMQQYRPAREEAVGAVAPERTEPGPEAEQPAPWGYELSLLGFETEKTDRAVEAIQSIVQDLAQVLPLRRLDGITVASDYAAALAAIDRGIPGIAPPRTVGAEIGTGIGQAVIVVRDGVVKGRVVLDQTVALCLLSDDPAYVDWAVHLFAHELVQVALIEILEEALPGAHLMTIGDPLKRWLYPSVDTALHGYVAAFISAGFGDPEKTVTATRQLAVEAILRMRSQVLEARLAYRFHADLGKLMEIAFPAIRLTLTFLADLLGYCAALGRPTDDEQGTLAEALKQADLQNWLPIFQRDLERFQQRVGRWESFDEFSTMSRHVERLLWQHGMFPWQTEEQIRVEIPLVSDAGALAAGSSGRSPAAVRVFGFALSKLVGSAMRTCNRAIRALQTFGGKRRRRR